jgi:hypothetical protein
MAEGCILNRVGQSKMEIPDRSPLPRSVVLVLGAVLLTVSTISCSTPNVTPASKAAEKAAPVVKENSSAVEAARPTGPPILRVEDIETSEEVSPPDQGSIVGLTMTAIKQGQQGQPIRWTGVVQKPWKPGWVTIRVAKKAAVTYEASVEWSGATALKPNTRITLDGRIGKTLMILWSFSNGKVVDQTRTVFLSDGAVLDAPNVPKPKL